MTALWLFSPVCFHSNFSILSVKFCSAATLICLENSFWQQTISSTTPSKAFLASWKQFIATGTKDRLVADLESLGKYPGVLPQREVEKTDEQRLYESSLVDILLKHRLGIDILSTISGLLLTYLSSPSWRGPIWQKERVPFKGQETFKEILREGGRTRTKEMHINYGKTGIMHSLFYYWFWHP